MKKKQPRKRKSKKLQVLSFILSFVFHGVAFFCVSVFFYLSLVEAINKMRTPQPQNLIEYKVDINHTKEDHRPELPCKPKTYEKVQKNLSSITKKQVNTLLSEAKELAKKTKDKVKRLTKIVKVHNTMVSEKGQTEIINLLGKKFKSKDFIPQKTPPKGEFDWNDFTIYKMEKLKPDGYKITFVDRKGRTVVKKYFGKAARDFDATYKAFSLCGKSKVLKSLLDYTLKSLPSFLK